MRISTFCWLIASLVLWLLPRSMVPCLNGSPSGPNACVSSPLYHCWCTSHLNLWAWQGSSLACMPNSTAVLKSVKCRLPFGHASTFTGFDAAPSFLMAVANHVFDPHSFVWDSVTVVIYLLLALSEATRFYCTLYERCRSITAPVLSLPPLFKMHRLLLPMVSFGGVVRPEFGVSWLDRFP